MPTRVVAVLLLFAAPALVLADRGAFSLEAGGVLAALRAAPAVGAGQPVQGTLGGATVGARYAFSNRLEATAAADWYAAAPFYNEGTVVATPNGSFGGQLQSRVGGYSARVGAQYVRGYTWRLRLGAELGWARVNTQRLDLVSVGTAAPHSFGLGLGSRSTDQAVMAALAGIEWAVSDRVSFTVAPRLQGPLGGRPNALTLPLTISYSWYLL